MQNYPAEFYSKETNFVHRAGYTLALALMGIGVLESAQSIPHILKGDSSPMSMALGPVVVACGGVVAYAYLREAKVLY
jgi:lysozyme family protein